MKSRVKAVAIMAKGTCKDCCFYEDKTCTRSGVCNALKKNLCWKRLEYRSNTITIKNLDEVPGEQD